MAVGDGVRTNQYCDFGSHFYSRKTKGSGYTFYVEASSHLPFDSLHYIIHANSTVIKLGVRLNDVMNMSKTQVDDVHKIFEQCDGLVIEGHEFTEIMSEDNDGSRLLVAYLPYKTPISYRVKLLEAFVTYMDSYWEKYL